MVLSFTLIPCGNSLSFERSGNFSSQTTNCTEVVPVAKNLIMMEKEYEIGCGDGAVFECEKSNLDFGPKSKADEKKKKRDKNNTNYLLTVRASQTIIFWLLSRLFITECKKA